MAWQTPKKDWTPSDVPLSADVNRWESNTEEAYNIANSAKYWGQLMHVSGCVGGGSAITVDNGVAIAVQSFFVAVKPRPGVGLGTSLGIRFIGFDLNANFRIRVQVEGESVYYQSATNQGYYDVVAEGAVNNTLYANYTDNPVYKKVIVSIVNIMTGQGSQLLSSNAGWSFQLTGVVTFG